MRCPIKREHTLVEVAPGVLQCPHCGYGPSQGGYRAFWALSNVDVRHDVVDATCIRFDETLDCYVMTSLGWEVDEDGAKIEGTFTEELVGYLSTKAELEGAALPVVIRAAGKWDYPPAKPALREGMFRDSLGPKEIALSSAQRDKSVG